MAQMAWYGALFTDKIVKQEKPDIYIGVQDIWGVDFAIEKCWFDKISSVIWTTLDSLPILPSAIKAAKKTKNYWVWSDFAKKALIKEGCDHVKTVHGLLEHDQFFPLDKERKKELRKENKIPQNAFVIGFVFRNQLRKSVSNLLRGYKIFKDNNKDIKNPRLLLHTDFGEGWDILRLADEIGISRNEIITTHLCGACLKYDVKPHEGKDKDCRHCGAKSSVNTAGNIFRRKRGSTKRSL